MLGLIDGNSFYCSCERAFDPRLRGKPVVVLSNNDGCVIARTQEAKDLGIKMGEPWHLAKRRPELGGVIAKSSNYALYGDMSRRMYEVLTEQVPRVEPYSIDEMFLDFAGMAEPALLAIDIRAAVLRSTKIPTCVGLGPTKTIAKLANAQAKKDRHGDGICDLSDAGLRHALYPRLAVSEVWGIGAASASKLEALGIVTIADFVALPRDAVRRLLSVVGLRVQAELLGESCLPLVLAAPSRKSLAVTRSFGRPVTAWDEIEQAVSAYAARAAEKLRRHGLVAGAMQVFLLTNRFAAGDVQRSVQSTFAIEATDDSFALIGAARAAMRRLYRDGYRYAKAGVVLLELARRDSLPGTLLPSRDPEVSRALMAAIDGLNGRYGRLTVRPGGVVVKGGWQMRQGNVSPCYTTRVGDILVARA